MTDLRRACGTLTAGQVNRALKAFPRMSEQSRQMARSYLVDGRLQVDIASTTGVSQERVRYVCAQVYRAHERLLGVPDDAVQPPARAKVAAKRAAAQG